MGFNFKALNSLIEFKYVTDLDLDNLSDEQLDDLENEVFLVKRGTFTIGDADASNTRVIKMNSNDGWDDKVFKGKVQYKVHSGTDPVV